MSASASRRVAFNAIAIDISINFQLKTILITHNAQCTVARGSVGSGGCWSGATKGRFVVGGAGYGVFVKLVLWPGGP